MKGRKLRQIAFGLLAVMPVVLAVATILEKWHGSEYALRSVYHSRWFVLLWAVLGVTSLIYLFYRKLYRQKALFLLHIALGIILAGAFVSYLTSERGYIHLRQGKPLQAYTAEDGEEKRPLPFTIRLLLFEIEYHPGTDEPADFISFLKIDDEMCKVSMNKIHVSRNYRLYQISYDPDEMGTTLLVSRDPFGIGITYAGYILLAIAMGWLLWLRIGWKGVCAITVTTLFLWIYISRINPMTPVLRTPMLATHVSVIFISYLLFLLITVNSIIGIASKRRRVRLYRYNRRLLYPALFLLAAGIFIGAVWANISWGRYWGWDAKETWALITLLVYAIPMHRKSLPQLSDPLRFHRYCLIAFLCVLMTFLGVSFLLGGLHSYL